MSKKSITLRIISLIIVLAIAIYLLIGLDIAYKAKKDKDYYPIRMINEILYDNGGYVNLSIVSNTSGQTNFMIWGDRSTVAFLVSEATFKNWNTLSVDHSNMVSFIRRLIESGQPFHHWNSTNSIGRIITAIN